MSSGINFDEEKRRMQYMQFRAEQNLENHSDLEFTPKAPPKSGKNLALTLVILGLLVLGLFLASRAGFL